MESVKFQEELVKRSDADNYVNALEEWQEMSEAEFSYVDDFTHRCICGQRIKKAFTIKNNVNGNSIEVGRECVKKFVCNVWDESKWLSCEKMINEVSKDKSLIALNNKAISLMDCAMYKLFANSYKEKTLNGNKHLSSLSNKLREQYIKKIEKIADIIKNQTGKISLKDAEQLYNDIQKEKQLLIQYFSKISDKLLVSYFYEKISAWEVFFYRKMEKRKQYGYLTQKQERRLKIIKNKIYNNKKADSKLNISFHDFMNKIIKCESDLENEIYAIKLNDSNYYSYHKTTTNTITNTTTRTTDNPNLW